MTTDNDNDMMLKSEKIDLQTPILSASNWRYFYCLKSSLWCSVFTYHDAHKEQFGDMNRPENDRRSGKVTGLMAINNGTVPVRWPNPNPNQGLELFKPENPGLEKTGGFANPTPDVGLNIVRFSIFELTVGTGQTDGQTDGQGATHCGLPPHNTQYIQHATCFIFQTVFSSN